MTTKDKLASKQQQMRERWANRPAKGKPANSPPTLPVRVAVQRAKGRVVKSSYPFPTRVALPPPNNSAPAKSILRRAERTAHRNQCQETLALGFSLGVPPVRVGYSTAEVEYACVCVAHSAITRVSARAAGASTRENKWKSTGNRPQSEPWNCCANVGISNRL
jgi:hypothetical protein